MQLNILNTDLLKQNHDLMLEWISANKPDQSVSNRVYELFIERSIINGNQEFIQKTRKIIKKTSLLATGITVLQRLLSTGKEIKISEGKEACFIQDKGLFFAFGKCNTFVVTKKNDGDLELTKQSNAATFIHECLHQWHFDNDAENHNSRINSKGSIDDMDDKEEELTITGNLHLLDEKQKDLCSENTVLIEQGLNSRINHRGVTLNKGSSPSLFDMICCRAIGNIKKELTINPNLIEKEQKLPNPRNQFLVDYLMSRIILEANPVIKNELLAITHLLIDFGFKSDTALKLAVLDNSMETVSKLINSGTAIPKDYLNIIACSRMLLTIEVLDLLKKSAHICSPILPSELTFDSDSDLELYREKYRKQDALKNALIKKIDSFELSTEMFRLLIKGGAQCSEKQCDYFISFGNLKGLDLVINSGIESPTKLLEYAVLNRCSLKVFKFLMERGAELNQTIIEDAIFEHSAQVVNFLIETGVITSSTIQDLFSEANYNNFQIKEFLKIAEAAAKSSKEKSG